MDTAPEGGAGSDDTHRDNGSVAGIARWDTCGRGIVRTGSSNADAIDSYPQEVEVSLAPDAAVCGSLGCRESGSQLRVTVGGETRVLCPDCATEFAERKAGRSRAQSERGLDSAERSAEAEPEARTSGQSDGTRSVRSETSGGSGGGRR